MIGRLESWFRSRSGREQRLLVVMVTLIALTIGWAGILRPVREAIAAARTRHSDSAADFAVTRVRVAEVEALERARPLPLAAPLDMVIRDRANGAGFSLATVTGGSDASAQIGISSARPGALISWIGGLENDGILVDTLTMTDNGDKTVAAQISLRVRG